MGLVGKREKCTLLWPVFRTAGRLCGHGLIINDLPASERTGGKPGAEEPPSLRQGSRYRFYSL